MKRLSLVSALMACVFALALAGCSAAPAQSADSDSLKGFWVIDEVTHVGFDAALNLDDDDLAELMISDSYLEGSWKTDGKEATVTFEDEDAKTAKLFVSEGKLTLGDANGSRLVFVKGDMDEYFADQDDGADDEVIDLDSDSTEMEIVDEVINDITPVTVANDSTCKIEVTGKGTDFTGDPGYRLSLTNNGTTAVYIMADETFKVGDKEIEPGMGEVVEPGKSVETFMYFPKDELGGGVDALKNVTGKIIVGDDETGDEIATYDVSLD